MQTILLSPENSNVLEKSNKQDFKWTKNELVMLFWLSGTLKSSNWVTFFLVKLASFLKCLQCKHFVYLSKSKKHF